MNKMKNMEVDHCNIIDAICPYEHSCSVCRLHSDYETAKEKAKKLAEKDEGGTGMTQEELKIGDKVQMNDKYYVFEKNKEKIFTVTTEPQDVCGTLSVFLEGFRGCYACDGLRKINS